jgi:homoserine dehydrogenase
MDKEKIQVGLLGFGVVGGGTVKLLRDNAESIARKVGFPVEVKKVAVRDLSKPRQVDLPAGMVTDNPNDVIDDPDIDIVCELMGGVQPAYDYVLRAIQNGKNIVTANKEMMAKAGHNLLHEAEHRKLDFNFEGSVGGGIPIIQPLKQALAGNRFKEVIGIVNGTTNYILSKMTAEGADFGDVLAEAQAHGYAEADPTSDVGGFDAQYKTAILASIAFTSRIDLADIYVEGITGIAKRDIEVARELGYVIKLVGIGQDLGDALQVRVHPTLLPKAHPLASVNDVYNAVFVRGDAVGDVMFYGRGAGSGPTGSAVVGDIIEIARNIRREGTGRMGCTCFDRKPARDISHLETKYYIRLVAHDRPKVLASLASILGDFDVSIESVLQHPLPDGDAEIVLITHRTLEANLRSAIDVFKRLDIVSAVQNSIRVEE